MTLTALHSLLISDLQSQGKSKFSIGETFETGSKKLIKKIGEVQHG